MIVAALTIERRTGGFTYMRFSDGFRMKWNEAMSVYITLEQTYMKKVAGLCGTYTSNRDGKCSFALCPNRSAPNETLCLDDLLLPDGSLSASVTNFGNEWRTDSSVSLRGGSRRTDADGIRLDLVRCKSCPRRSVHR